MYELRRHIMYPSEHWVRIDSDESRETLEKRRQCILSHEDSGGQTLEWCKAQEEGLIIVPKITREDFAKKIHWLKIIWLAGLVSIVAMLPQLIKIIVTQKVDDLSLPMFFLTFLIQAAFSIEGYFKRNMVLMFCPGGAAVVTFSIVVLIVVFGYI